MKIIYQKHFVLIILLTAVLIQTSCTKKEQAKEDSTPPKETHDSVVITQIGIDSLTVLEVLEKEYQTTTVKSAMGTFVKGIDDVENNRNTFWFFSVNGVMAIKAADNIMTQNSDTIVWYFRQIGVESSEDEKADNSDSI